MFNAAACTWAKESPLFKAVQVWTPADAMSAGVGVKKGTRSCTAVIASFTSAAVGWVMGATFVAVTGAALCVGAGDLAVVPAGVAGASVGATTTLPVTAAEPTLVGDRPDEAAEGAPEGD